MKNSEQLPKFEIGQVWEYHWSDGIRTRLKIVGPKGRGWGIQWMESHGSYHAGGLDTIHSGDFEYMTLDESSTVKLISKKYE